MKYGSCPHTIIALPPKSWAALFSPASKLLLLPLFALGPDAAKKARTIEPFAFYGRGLLMIAHWFIRWCSCFYEGLKEIHFMWYSWKARTRFCSPVLMFAYSIRTLYIDSSEYVVKFKLNRCTAFSLWMKFRPIWPRRPLTLAASARGQIHSQKISGKENPRLKSSETTMTRFAIILSSSFMWRNWRPLIRRF